MSHEPVEEEYRAQMNAVAQGLAEVFDGLGFCLLVFELGTEEGRVNYISNTNKQDMIIAMKEYISRVEFGDQDSEMIQ